MKLGDVYKHKENNSIIQIDSFAAPMGRFFEGKSIIVFRQIEKHNDMFGSLPSFNGYGSQEEIESEYELLVSQEDLSNYSDWNEIFELMITKESKLNGNNDFRRQERVNYNL